MMLHEAVMLEIYRQALNASELASPRCHSRESNASGIAGDGRCPSNDSHCSANDNVTPVATPVPTTPPMSLPLTATLAPAAAAALLPPQSAAMAAYLNAAAAAAQQNHLLLTNPLAAAASFVQQATQAHSPHEHKRTPSTSPRLNDAPALDFSRKNVSDRRESETGSGDEDDEADGDKKQNPLADSGGESNATEDANCPLDLSLSTTRKRQSSDDEVPLRKTARPSDYKPLPPGTWVPPINPYLAAVAAASLSPKTPDSWSGKPHKYVPNEATKALEKMTEMTRLGGACGAHEGRNSMQSAGTPTTATASNGRHSAWQSHWLTKGADAVKDVFKCVWCKQSFPTLATLTLHMKETQHCGVNVPAAVAAGTANATNAAGTGVMSAAPQHAARHSNTQGSSGNSNSQASATNAASAAAASKSDLSLLIKETMPLPRKLVRGQDVWLGKGAEQTRQILKCMWCGQSFRSLAEMTSHMQETQHYTNIISQEQIISWKSTDDKQAGNGANASPPGAPAPQAASAAVTAVSINAATTANPAVSAVLTCKVCDQAFPSLKELSSHMVKNAHMLRADASTPNNALPTTNATRRGGGGRQARGEKRKKSLPVRKLLELERAQHDYKNSANNSLDSALKPLRDFAASTKITCEKCGDKIETALFVDHIRQCLGGHIPMSPRHNNNNNNNSTHNFKHTYGSPQTSSSQSDGRKTADLGLTSPLASSTRADILCPLPKEGEKPASSSTPSVLNAIEQLIEKSFDTRMRSGAGSSYGGSGSKPNTPLGSSILKRLGIDDSVDYTKPLIDTQTMHFLRSYSSYSAPRDRSASESSSVSERCSSRLESSSVTPERSTDLSSRQPTPRLVTESERETPPKIKTEPDEATEREAKSTTPPPQPTQKISVKKEFTMSELHERDEDVGEVAAAASHVASPDASERSLTPKSNSSQGEKHATLKTAAGTAGSSLTALSSMFDNLNNMHAAALSNAETNNNHNGGKKSTANPLAALQKLCDTTSDAPAANTRSNITTTASTNSGGGGGGGGNMVAFSWACNDAVLSAADAMIKCAFCDTPFSSKGAYRHHLSKVHFVKDDIGGVECGNTKSPGSTVSPKSMPTSSPKRCNSKSPITQRQSVSPASSVANSMTPTINPFDESPQSKFLKYTELAKQLSSKNA